MDCPACGRELAIRDDEPVRDFMSRKFCNTVCYRLFRAHAREHMDKHPQTITEATTNRLWKHDGWQEYDDQIRLNQGEQL